MPRASWAVPASAAGLALLLGAGPAAAAGPSRHDWTWPLAGTPRVVRAFDPPSQRWAAGHRGVDLLGRDGVVVRAAGAGAVSFAGAVAGRGVVVVTHGDGTRTTYQPVTSTVKRGDQVLTGEAIGRLSAAGGHCLPSACLHWGRRRGEVYLDPMLLLRRGPARLLPVWAGTHDGTPLPRSPSGQEPATGSAPLSRSASPASVSSWRLASAVGQGAPVRAAAALLLALVVHGLRRRRRQSRAGSSAASRA